MSRLWRFLGGVVEFCLFAIAWMMTIACVAMPRFHCGGKDRAYVTAMKSDLRNISAMYAAGDSLQHFRSSTGVTVTYSGGTPATWRARATHQLIEGSCSVDSSGEPGCDVRIKRPRVAPQLALFNYTTESWLFAYSLRRSRRRRAIAALESRYS